MVLPANADRGPISVAAEREARADDLGGSWRADDSGADPGQEHRSTSPIFLHSSWRASHTWFWLKFRKYESTVCFYEPFHEILATVTRSEALSLAPHSWNSRHPAAEAYLLEFIPLIRKTGGVRLFVPEISHRWFLPAGGPGGDLHPQEIKYLALLMRHANRLRRIPVFGFTRSLGRLAAIKKRFPGIHIFQYRNLWAQWMSWIDYKQNNNCYFFQKLLIIMIETQDAYLSAVISHYTADYSRYESTSYDRTSEALADKLLESIADVDLFTLYMALHTYLYMSAYKSAEVVIDTTKLARDQKYRAWAYDQLTSATGLPITFDDAAEVQKYRPFDSTLIDWQKIRENLDAAVIKLDQLFDREELLRYGTELVNETLAEIEISRKISDQRASCNNDAAEQA